jgi:hypothetical protein
MSATIPQTVAEHPPQVEQCAILFGLRFLAALLIDGGGPLLRRASAQPTDPEDDLPLPDGA